jgi:hypothetical protein
MALSALDDKARKPGEKELAATLGAARALWDDLERQVQEDCGPLAQQWHHAGERYGWSLRLRDKKRVVVYLTPGQGCFLAGLVLGERAVAGARNSGLPRPVLALIEAARPYAEGRGIRIEVRDRKALAAVRKLVALKLGS